MQDETPPWAETVDDTVSSSVDPRVIAGMTIWMVAFGWYFVLQATPRGGLSAVDAGVLYAASVFAAGICFGAGERRIYEGIRSWVDGPGLLLGGTAGGSLAFAWYVLATPASPYVGGLWLGVMALATGLVIGAGLR